MTHTAAGLAALGVDKSNLVPCQLPNWWQIKALHLACMRIGAILNPTRPVGTGAPHPHTQASGQIASPKRLLGQNPVPAHQGPIIHWNHGL